MNKAPILILLLALSAVPRLWAVEHPVALEKGADTNCLECHEDKGKGKFVHTAISMGCTACHEVKTEKDTTTVGFTLPKEELCFSCHEKSKEVVRHGPYDKGQCVRCHDPHVTDFDNHLRAEGNALCQECHLPRRTTDANVTLFKSVTIPDAEFQEIPKIGLDATLKRGHPMGMHAVSGVPDTLNPGKKMSCLSCHHQHAAPRESLVRMVDVRTEVNGGGTETKKTETKKMDVCDACHMASDDARMAEAQKKALEQEAERQKENDAQRKGAVTSGPRPKSSKPKGNN